MSFFFLANMFPKTSLFHFFALTVNLAIASCKMLSLQAPLIMSLNSRWLFHIGWNRNVLSFWNEEVLEVSIKEDNDLSLSGPSGTHLLLGKGLSKRD